MNHKINSAKRGGINGAVLGIPIRFDPGQSFVVKVKKASGKNRMPDFEPPLIPELLEMHSRAGRTQALRALPLYKRGHSMASITLEERMLDQRRLEAVFKTGRKKRC